MRRRELTDGETVVLDLRPHGGALVLPVLVLVVVLGAAGYGVARLASAPGDLAVMVVAVLVLVRLSLAPFLRWRSTRFVLTDERVAVRRGVLRRSGRDVPLSRVDEVLFAQSLGQRLVGTGTLTVTAGDAEPLVVPGLRRVQAVQRAVYRQIDSAR